MRRTRLRIPDKTAIVYRGIRQTYAELDATVNRMANALSARGVGKGDRIALFSHNNHAFVVAYLALARLGAVSVPINFMLAAHEVRYMLEHSEASGLIVEDALLPVAEEALADALPVRGVIPDGGGEVSPGWESVADWMTDGDATEPDVDIAEEDLAQLIYTSGTESRPKGAML